MHEFLALLHESFLSNDRHDFYLDAAHLTFLLAIIHSCTFIKVRTSRSIDLISMGASLYQHSLPLSPPRSVRASVVLIKLYNHRKVYIPVHCRLFSRLCSSREAGQPRTHEASCPCPTNECYTHYFGLKNMFYVHMNKGCDRSNEHGSVTSCPFRADQQTNH